MIKLGDEVKDRVSGFRGIAISRHEYLQGCSRVTIQPPVNEKGELPDCKSFDEPDLILLVSQKIQQFIRPEPPGGPDKYMDMGRRDEGRREL